MLAPLGNKARGLELLKAGGFHVLPMVCLDAEALRSGAPIPQDQIAQRLHHPVWYAVRSSSAT